ncbi:MAG: HAMP domain-containing histidine kinase [Chitinophagales bacterium]|nr:HAMP domain-containing histidine kinase [Chitinophagales bacterium]
MKKSRIWIIIGLMSTALLGIIMVQAYWINSTISQKEKIFSYQVQEALKTVTEKSEKHWIATMFQKQLADPGFDSLYAAVSVNDLTAEQILNDSIISQIVKSTKANEIITQDLQGIRGAINSEGISSSGPTMYLTPMEFNGNISGDPYSTGDELASNILIEIDKQFQLNAGKLNEVMQQMMLEMMSQGITPAEKIDSAYLNKLLLEELGARGIETEFHYGVLVDNKYLFSTQTSDQKTTLINSPYKASLFPGNIFTTSDILLVDFPNQQTYLLSSVKLLLFGSLLFTAIIILMFGYTMQIIFRQKKLSEIKSDFINNMTHEFKTPLATISLAVDAINNPTILGNSEKVKYYSHLIKEENKRMNGQVEKVLQMALLDKNEIAISTDEVDMHDIIQRAVENISLRVAESGGKITTELHAVNCEIVADEVHMMNVISNLLDNAVKYSDDKVEIKITTDSDDKGVHVSIQDAGIGMSTEHQKMIFEKFYRVPTGNIHNVQGFGLGLTYVKAIVEAHNGLISVKSNPGKGSRFNIFLPFNN